jgi:Holliday junction resolvase RusA-like endonuclease
MNESLINYKIVIPGEPIKKERHRTVYKDRNGKALPFPRTYNPQEDEEAAYRWAAIQYLTKNYGGLFMLENCPIAMGLTYIMPVRKNWPQYKIRDLNRGMTFYHFKKPDLDNCIKFTKDVLEGLCYKNDSQIALMDPPPVKIYGLEAKTIIQIRTLPEFEMTDMFSTRLHENEKESEVGQIDNGRRIG